MKYHINPVTGNPRECRATVRCPFGDLDKDHYDSVSEARDAHERSMADFLLTSHTKYKDVESLEDFRPAAINILKSRAESSKSKIERGFYYQAAHDLSNGAAPEALLAIYREELKRVDNKHLLKALRDTTHLLKIAREIEYAENSLKDFEKHLDSGFTRSIMTDERSQDYRETLVLRVLESADKVNMARYGFQSEVHDDDDTYEVHPIEKVSLRTQEITFTEIDGDEFTLRDIISESDSVKFGKNSGIVIDTAHSKVKKDADELVSHWLGGVPMDGDESAPPGFKYLGRGIESAVYLHEATRIVYKIPPSDSILRDKKGEVRREAFINLQKRFAELDSDSLEVSGVEYIPTLFMEAGESKTPITVQPYLDSDLYMAYNPGGMLAEKLEEAGASDLWAANIRVNIKTKKIVLFDCLFAGR